MLQLDKGRGKLVAVLLFHLYLFEATSGRPCEQCAIAGKARAVAGAVPAFLGTVPLYQALGMGANGIEHVNNALLIFIKRYFFAIR